MPTDRTPATTHGHHATAAAYPAYDHASYTAMVMAASAGDASGHYAYDGGAYWSHAAYAASGTTDCTPVYAAPVPGKMNRSSSFHSAAGSSAPPSPSFTATSTASLPGKRYTHDPYASAPSTPTSAPQPASGSSSAFNTSADSACGQLPAALGGSMLPAAVGLGGTVGAAAAPGVSSCFAPVYAPEGGRYGEAGGYPAGHGVAEQFSSCVGHVATTACTPKGRHMLMSVLRLQHLDKVQAIFDEVLPCLRELATNQHGCHVVRTLIECITEDQLAALVATIPDELIVELATSSQYTRRIVQVMFERHKSGCLDHVVTVISRQCASVSCTQQGCIAVMRILENALPHQQRGLLDHLAPHLGALAIDAYGNYVVQAIIQHTTPEVACRHLAPAFSARWASLACNKFASNVLEKLLRVATADTRAQVVRTLCFEPRGLEAIMGDGFGNFVLQAIIETSTDPEEFRVIAELVRSLLPSSPYGHKIEAKLRAKRFQ